MKSYWRCACGQALGAPRKAAGRPMRCPRCGAEGTVPRPGTLGTQAHPLTRRVAAEPFTTIDRMDAGAAPAPGPGGYSTGWGAFVEETNLDAELLTD